MKAFLEIGLSDILTAQEFRALVDRAGQEGKAVEECIADAIRGLLRRNNEKPSNDYEDDIGSAEGPGGAIASQGN